MSRSVRRRIERLFREYGAVEAEVTRRLSANAFDRELDAFLCYATADELAELAAICDREMAGEGDEARVDEIHEQVWARVGRNEPQRIPLDPAYQELRKQRMRL